MYLLNPGSAGALTSAVGFTFHYVSIKSEAQLYLPHIGFDLHSTMYLLNPNAVKLANKLKKYLHSTMYLLNLNIKTIIFTTALFTFHYVSIKSVVGYFLLHI